MDLKELRKNKGLLIKQLAYQMGISQRTVLAWEDGFRGGAHWPDHSLCARSRNNHRKIINGHW